MPARPFRLLPVIDMKDGLVVHAIRGEREKYQPVKSILTSSAELSAVVAAFVNKLGLREFYLADLDAIAGGGFIGDARAGNLKILAQLIKANREMPGQPGKLSFMVDAGVRDGKSVEEVLKTGADQVIVGTETLLSLFHLEDIIQRYGSRRIVVSLDSRQGRILSRTPELVNLSPPQALRLLQSLGVKQFILLELHRVGTGAGLNRQLIRECLDTLVTSDFPLNENSLLVGGGVSGYHDLQWLAGAGVSGALVATAFHNGNLTCQDIKSLINNNNDLL